MGIHRLWGTHKQAKDPLPPREDMVEFYVHTNTKYLENNLKLQECPRKLKYQVKAVVPHYWDLICEDKFFRNIQVFSLQIDTVNHPPIFCKPTRYGPHESEFMRKILGRLDENGVMEKDNKL